MLPPSLKSIYQQYKTDTDSVATWLATTAKAHGYDSAKGSSKTGKSPASGGRRGRSTRKQGKAPSLPASSASAAGTRHVVAIKDFEPMAAHLAGIDAVHVPDHVTLALERVIWGTSPLSPGVRR